MNGSEGRFRDCQMRAAGGIFRFACLCAIMPCAIAARGADLRDRNLTRFVTHEIAQVRALLCWRESPFSDPKQRLSLIRYLRSALPRGTASYLFLKNSIGRYGDWRLVRGRIEELNIRTGAYKYGILHTSRRRVGAL